MKRMDGSGDDPPSLTAPTAEELAELAQVQHVGPAPARHGSLGTCRLCREPVAMHWDSAGRFLGCAAASPDTVFVLWPVSGKKASTLHSVAPMPFPGLDGDGDGDGLRMRRMRYRSKIPTHVDPQTLTLSPQRKQVLTAIHQAGNDGALAREIMERTGLPNGSVQMAAKWLREHNVVVVEKEPTAED